MEKELFETLTAKHEGLSGRCAAVQNEEEGLLEKITNLKAFFATNAYHDLGAVQKTQLRKQVIAMEAYAGCLKVRIDDMHNTLNRIEAAILKATSEEVDNAMTPEDEVEGTTDGVTEDPTKDITEDPTKDANVVEGAETKVDA